VDREAVRSDAGLGQRPTDADVSQLIGEAEPSGLSRQVVGDRVERIVWPRGRAILKFGGFRRADVEPRLYSRLSPAHDGSPTLLALDAERGWLLLEDLHPADSVVPSDSTHARLAYERLADAHAYHLGADYPELEQAPLSAPRAVDVERGAAELAVLVARAATDQQTWEIGPDQIAASERIAVWARTAGPRLTSSGPVTLLHGDYQRRNWLLVDGVIRVVDWELAALGPGVLDLYYLSPDRPGAGHAPSGTLAELAVQAYCRRLREREVSGPDPDGALALLPDAIAWGAIAAAVLRLRDFYADTPRGRTPRGELPGAAASLIGSALRRIR
jgi:hypothetical protein